GVGSRRLVIGHIGIKRIGAGGLRGTLRIDGTAAAALKGIRLATLKAQCTESLTSLARHTQLVSELPVMAEARRSGSAGALPPETKRMRFSAVVRSRSHLRGATAKGVSEAYDAAHKAGPMGDRSSVGHWFASDKRRPLLDAKLLAIFDLLCHEHIAEAR
ncbi:hypothetical protein T492DRAFT_872256, partial [Pavlovales sp. CCMP2436]